MKQDKIPTYIIVSREYFKSPMWKLREHQKRTKAEAYLDLFQMAIYRQSEYTTPDYKATIPLYRSEGVWSIRYLAKRWHWSKSKTETFLNLLKTRKKIRQEIRQGIMVTFLIDYDDSQKKEKYGKVKKKDSKQDTESDRVRTGSGQGQDKYNTDKKECNKEVCIPKSPENVIPPLIDDIQAYIQDKGYSVDAECFFDFYESKGWKVGNNKMKNWHAAVRTWQSKNKTEQKSSYEDLTGKVRE